MKNMKKAVIGSLAAGMVLTIGATNAFAAGRGTGAARNFSETNKAGKNYVDIDEDGICDNFVDIDEDGSCDNYGAGQCKRFRGGRNK